MSICKFDTITIEAEVPPIDKPTLKAPTFVFVNKPFTVTGKTPKPNQTVWIELEKILVDEQIASGSSDSDRHFEIEVTLTKVEYAKIHSEIEKPFAVNPTSPSVGVLVVDYWILFALGALIIFILYKKGAFKKITKKRKRRKK